MRRHNHVLPYALVDLNTQRVINNAMLGQTKQMQLKPGRFQDSDEMSMLDTICKVNLADMLL